MGQNNIQQSKQLSQGQWLSNRGNQYHQGTKTRLCLKCTFIRTSFRGTSYKYKKGRENKRFYYRGETPQGSIFC